MDRKNGIMTLREVTGFLLLIFLLLAGLLWSRNQEGQHLALAEAVEECAGLACRGQWDAACAAAEEAKAQWEENRHLRAALGAHAPMEEIDEAFLELTFRAGDREGFAEQCALLSRKLRSLGQLQSLHWWNIL